MVVGEVAERADVVVIGAGPGGYVAALRCANAGKNVILVEREAVGGVCLNVGCIPSKVLIHSAEAAAMPRHSSAWGVTMTAAVDPVQIQMHMADVVSHLTGGVQTLLDSAGVEVWHGEARFSRPDRLAVVTGDLVKHLEFGHCIIATGSRPTVIGGLPVDLERVIDSTGALHLIEVPKSLVVIGGGYIGVELGTAWAKLGSAVTIIEGESRLLPAMDKRLSSEVQRRLKTLGVVVRTNTMVSGIGDPLLSSADKIVVAVGRTPNTDDLGLDAAGIDVDDAGLIPVGPDRRASKRIFAIGDVTAGPALAHKATAEAEVVARVIAGHAAEFNPTAIPEVVFSDPQIANVGHSPATATAVGITPQTFRFPYAAGSRSRTLDDTTGFVQIVADEQGTVIGAQLAGAGVAELVGELTLAIELCATVDEIAETIHAHPTMSEAIGEAALGLLGHPLHVRR